MEQAQIETDTVLVDVVNTAPELLVLIGVPGSGKSTWAKVYVESSNLEYDVVSSDAVLERIASEKGLKYSDVYKDYIGLATSECKRQLADAMRAGRNIIIDQTNVSKKKRRGILQQLPKNYRKIAVVFQTEDREVERRLKLRAEQTGKYIPEQVMKDMYGRWEAPTREEGFELIIKA